MDAHEIESFYVSCEVCNKTVLWRDAGLQYYTYKKVFNSGLIMRYVSFICQDCLCKL